MTRLDVKNLILSGRLSRREMAELMAYAGLVPAALTFGRPARAAEPTDITYFTWASYEVPELHPSYIEKYGGSPTSTFFADTDEALQKVRAGFTPDLVHPCTAAVGKWHDAGVLQPIDTERLRNWPDLIPALTNVEGTVIDGEYWFVPTDWGTSSVVYRTDMVEIEEESWSLLYDERYAGRLSSWDDGPTNVMIAAWVLGFENDLDLTEEQLAEIRPLLEKQRDVQRMYWSSRAAFDQALASGEVVAGYSWNSTVLNMTSQGIPVAYMNPKEGLESYVCGMVYVNGAPGPAELAYDFMDAWTDPEAGKFLTESYGYGHSNRKTFDLVDVEHLKSLGIANPEDLFAAAHFSRPIPPESNEAYEALFQEVIAGF